MKFCGIFSVLLISCVIVASDDSNTTTVSTMVPSTTQSSPTASPTSATTPAPATRPDGGRWNVTDESTNIVCILFDGGIRIETMPQTVVDIPANATASGSCNSFKQDIMFTFMANSMNWNLSFIFSKAVNETKYNLTDFILVNDASGAAKINDKGAVNEGVLNSEDISRSYVCSKMQTVYGPKNITSGLKLIKIVGVKFEAFRNTTTDIFGLADKCTADDVSQLVPIIVGAALAGLIIIVLIAYLIGRKRSKRGYESV